MSDITKQAEEVWKYHREKATGQPYGKGAATNSCRTKHGEYAGAINRLLAENKEIRKVLPYDWDLLQASQESLREHMVMVKELQAKLLSAVSIIEKVKEKPKSGEVHRLAIQFLSNYKGGD